MNSWNRLTLCSYPPRKSSPSRPVIIWAAGYNRQPRFFYSLVVTAFMSTRLHLRITLLLTLMGCQQEPSGHQELPTEATSSQPASPRKVTASQPTTYLTLTYDLRGPGEHLSDRLVKRLTKRLDPHGIKGIRVRLTESKQV